MNISTLESYIAQKNQWRSVFGHNPLNLMRDAQKIADEINCDMSPENISCDGEISISKIRARRSHLDRVARQFLSVHPNIEIWEV